MERRRNVGGLYAIRTTVGQEKNVALMIAELAKARGIEIKSVLAPEEMHGYVLVEADGEHLVRKAIQGVKHVRSRVIGRISLEEVRELIVARSPIDVVEVGDVVEIMGGIFKGERGVVTQVKREKNEVTIQLLTPANPLQVTLNANFIKIVEKSKTEE